jgi:hypothetical protein
MSATEQEQMARIVVGSYPASDIKLSAKYENSKAISASIVSTISRISPPDVTSMMDKQKPQTCLPRRPFSSTKGCLTGLSLDASGQNSPLSMTYYRYPLFTSAAQGHPQMGRTDFFYWDALVARLSRFTGNSRLPL